MDLPVVDDAATVCMRPRPASDPISALIPLRGLFRQGQESSRG
jgi:hypothetical protein